MYISVYYTNSSVNNHLWNTFVCFLLRELFGIQERFSVSNKATSGLLGGIEASYTPVRVQYLSYYPCPWLHLRLG